MPLDTRCAGTIVTLYIKVPKGTTREDGRQRLLQHYSTTNVIIFDHVSNHAYVRRILSDHIGSLSCATLTNGTKHGRDVSTHMLVPCVCRYYDYSIGRSATTAHLQLVHKARITKLPNHGRAAAGMTEMTNPRNGIKVKMY
jgi:hypothetical protein